MQSFDWRTLQIVQKLEPGLRTVYLSTQGRNNTLADGELDGPACCCRNTRRWRTWSRPPAGAVWSPNFNDITSDAVKGAQALGLLVIPWTVNNPADMERLIGWGVDGIISDYPDRLREVMRRRGMALPKGL